MNRVTVIRVLFVILVVLGLLALSCSSSEVTRTVTINNIVPTTVQGAVLTTTLAPNVLTPIFSAPPPDIPHVYLIVEMGNPYIGGLIADSGAAICFECHPMPSQHEQWRYDPNICLDCHRISPDPVLRP